MRSTTPVGNDPLRVLHVTSVETSNYFLNNLVDYTDRNEIRYSALTLAAEGGFTRDLSSRGVRSYAVNGLGRSHYLRVSRQIDQVIRRDRIEIVNTHLFEPTLVAATVAKMRSLKIVVTRHHSDALYRISNLGKRLFYLMLERYINAIAHRIIAPSRMVYDILTKREGVPPDKISLIPYGQTLERFNKVTCSKIAEVRNELGMQDNAALVCIARLHEEKGHRYLIEAFRELLRAGVRAKLYLVGTGPELANLQTLVQQMGLGGQVQFLGWRDDALAVIAAADMVVHSSLQEALPSAVIEALVLGRAVVATDVSGVRDVLGDNTYGIVVAPGSAQALYGAIAEMLRDLQNWQERAVCGKAFVLQSMSAQRVATEYKACYRQIMPHA